MNSMYMCDADSSYDSDDEATGDEIIHKQVSRTSSDTLGQEFSEYVNHPTVNFSIDQIEPEYTQRVDFALKLGYSERLVQLALCKLGIHTNQNELLAELIKLGSQTDNQDVTVSNNDLKPIDWVQQPTSAELDPIKCIGVLGPGEVEPEIPRFEKNTNGLRPIVVDGSNVAMCHGNKEIYSCRGIKLCVDWFRARGHNDITVFVPKWRKENSRADNFVRDQHLLQELEQERHLVFTPSRFICGKRQVCYDDRYILKLAFENDGIVVSNDNFRDLVAENSDFRKVANERVLMFTFVNDKFMPPDDPMGRSGPCLESFLRFLKKKCEQPPICPYGKKCTYGNKCKFHHPERGNVPQKTVTERLSEHATKHVSVRNIESHNHKIVLKGKSLSVPLPISSGEIIPICNDDSGLVKNQNFRRPLGRTRSAIPDIAQSSLSSSPHMDHQVSVYTSVGNQYLEPANDQHLNSSRVCRDGICYGICTSCATNQELRFNTPHPQYISKIQPMKSFQSFNQLNSEFNDGSGCDSRIPQLQQRRINHHHEEQLKQRDMTHRPLTPSLSGPQMCRLTHRNITRKASAPETIARTSDTHSTRLQQTPNCTALNTTSNHLDNQLDERRHLQFHLSNIFPENVVQHAMQLYPDETNPRKLCVAILNTFPKL